MSNATATMAGIIVLLAISLGLGFYGTKYATSTEKFMGGTKSFGPVLVTLSALSAMASGVVLVGTPGAIYGGNTVLCYWALSSCLFAMAYYAIGKKYRACAEITTINTIGDICDLRFKSPAVKGVTSIILLLGSVAYLAAQINVMTAMFGYLYGWSKLASACLTIGVVILYVVISGECGGILTQAFQAIVILAGGVLVAIFFFVKCGGFGEVLNAVNSAGTVVGVDGIEKIFSAANVSGYGTAKSGLVLATLFIPIFGSMCQPQTIARMYAVKDARDLPKMGIMSGFLHLLVGLFSVLIAFIGLYLVSTGKLQPFVKNDYTTYAVGQYLGLIPQILIYSAVVAATLSSASFYLMNCATYISRDLLSACGLRLQGKKQINATRVFAALIGIASILYAVYSINGAQMLLTFGWGTLMSATIPVFIMGILWKRCNKTGVLAGEISALVLNVVFMILVNKGVAFPNGMPWYVFVIMVAIVVTTVVSLLTYNDEKDAIDKKFLTVMNL